MRNPCQTCLCGLPTPATPANRNPPPPRHLHTTRFRRVPPLLCSAPAADVYFPKRKDTFRRRPFCFVTFARLEDAQRAVAESPMNICGIAIKQLNLVEDRSDYYKHRHTGELGVDVLAAMP